MHFFKAEEIRQKREQDIRDARNWQLAYYVTLGHAVNLGAKVKFPDKPMFQTKEEKHELSEQEIKNERLKCQLFFKNLGNYVAIKK